MWLYSNNVRVRLCVSFSQRRRVRSLDGGRRGKGRGWLLGAFRAKASLFLETCPFVGFSFSFSLLL